MMLRKLLLSPTTTPGLNPQRLICRSLSTSSTSFTREESESFFAALPTFQSQYGHVHIRPSFVIPKKQLWPKELQRYPLGQVAEKLRQLKKDDALSRDDMDRLTAAGFTWDYSPYAHVLFPMIEHFEKVHRHIRVPKNYIIPQNKAWPRYYWNIKLGEKMQLIRYGYIPLNAEQKKVLDGKGFAWNPNIQKWRTQQFPALVAFAKIYGHADVPRKFIVPARADWPEELHGHHLGQTFHVTTAGYLYNYISSQDRETLESLGYTIRALKGKRVKPACSFLNPKLNLQPSFI